MSIRKSLLRILALYAVTFVVVYLIPEHIHRRDFDRAFITWLHNRTAQNEAALRVEQRKNEIIELKDSAAITLIIATLGLGIYFAIRFAKHELHRKREDQTPENPLVQ
jgi:hypothetical protein